MPSVSLLLLLIPIIHHLFSHGDLVSASPMRLPIAGTLPPSAHLIPHPPFAESFPSIGPSSSSTTTTTTSFPGEEDDATITAIPPAMTISEAGNADDDEEKQPIPQENTIDPLSGLAQWNSPLDRDESSLPSPPPSSVPVVPIPPPPPNFQHAQGISSITAPSSPLRHARNTHQLVTGRRIHAVESFPAFQSLLYSPGADGKNSNGLGLLRAYSANTMSAPTTSYTSLTSPRPIGISLAGWKAISRLTSQTDLTSLLHHSGAIAQAHDLDVQSSGNDLSASILPLVVGDSVVIPEEDSDGESGKSHASLDQNNHDSTSDSTALQSIPADVLDYLFKYLAPRDIARLGAASNSMHLEVNNHPEIRLLYAQNQTYAETVSPTKLYHFCLYSASELVPTHFPTLFDCFANVDRLVDPSAVPLVRLQLLYDIIQTSKETPDENDDSPTLAEGKPVEKDLKFVMAESLIHATVWSEAQAIALLYFSAKHSVHYFDVLYEAFCPKGESVFELPEHCRYALMLLRRDKIPLINLESDLKQEMNSKQWNDSKSEWNLLNAGFCQVESHHGLYPDIHAAVLQLLSNGANIHDWCLYNLLFNKFTHAELTSRNPDAIVFIQHLLELGFAVNNNHRTALLLVIENPALIELLLDAGADVNFVSTSGNSALSNACRKDEKEKAELLLNHGANPNLSGSRVCHLPIMHCESPEICALLLANGANPRITDHQGHSPLYAATTRYRSLELVRLLVEHGADIHKNLSLHQTLLMVVLHAPIAAYLLSLDSAPSFIDAVDDLGRTALHYAITRWSYPVAELLISAGAQVDIQDRVNGQTALMLSDSVQATRLLLTRGHADPNIQDRRGYTALMLAALAAKKDMVRLLIDNGARCDLVSAEGKDVHTLASERFEVLHRPGGKDKSIILQLIAYCLDGLGPVPSSAFVW